MSTITKKNLKYPVNFLLIFLLLFTVSCSADKKNILKIGGPAPEFSIPDLAGQPVSLQGLKGHPVVIRFFLTDCKFCRADTPEFVGYYNENREKGLEIIYINISAANETEVRNFAEELAIPFPVIYDNSGQLGKLYNIKAQPLTLILAPDLQIASALLGGVSRAELAERLGPYLSEK